MLSSGGDPSTPVPEANPHVPRGEIPPVAGVMSRSVPEDPSRRHVMSSLGEGESKSRADAHFLFSVGAVRLFRTGCIGSVSEAIFPSKREDKMVNLHTFLSLSGSISVSIIECLVIPSRPVRLSNRFGSSSRCYFSFALLKKERKINSTFV
ncbi:hypothetical protein MRB53_015938 [Persea americana]|uniref:Uncharacterized protein n=1 Tax=Persea americana TaxID=3435 RepID=A0ACC2M0X3_PERAE|nr:hypothetical protein MRB53_015938 [Persea americana]